MTTRKSFYRECFCLRFLGWLLLLASCLLFVPSRKSLKRRVFTQQKSELLSQWDALKQFYDETKMFLPESKLTHNWFQHDPQSKMNDDKSLLSGQMAYCDFTGVVCDNEGYVEQISLVDRGLSGSMLTLDGFSKLQKLNLSHNQLHGSLPVDLFYRKNLKELDVSNNFLEGSIPRAPASIMTSKNNPQPFVLERLMLQDNENMVGPIPTELCHMTRLRQFDISRNVGMAGGHIPSCGEDDLADLEYFKVDEVGLIGTIPSALCNNPSMNGINPNIYGCDAVACPPGTFEPTLGRQRNSFTHCQPCPKDVPSNVLGALVCKDSTSLFRSSPSPALRSMRRIAAAATMTPSFTPTNIQDLSPLLSQNPTNTTVSQLSEVAGLIFENVNATMKSEQSIAAFEGAILSVLERQEATSFESVKLVSQSVEHETPLQSLPANSVLIWRDEEETQLGCPCLHVQVEINGTLDAQDEYHHTIASFSFEQAISQAFESGNEDLRSRLIQSDIPLFARNFLNTNSTTDDTNDAQVDNYSWKLLYVSIVVASFGIWSVTVVRITGRWRKTRTDAKPPETTSHPVMVNSGSHQESSDSESGWDWEVSEESDSGWHTESDSTGSASPLKLLHPSSRVLDQIHDSWGVVRDDKSGIPKSGSSKRISDMSR